MIRIEGIPVVAARLNDAQKAKSIQGPSKTRKTSTTAIKGAAPVRLRSALQTKVKVA